MRHGHGHGGGQENAEPNLTPLLDMVLQLVMFFMLVANFSMEQVNENIKLPTALSAKPMDKSDVDVLFLNVNADGHVVVPGRQAPLTNQDQILFYLNDQAKIVRDNAQAKGEQGEDLKMAVIIRADHRADYAQIYSVLRVSKQAGFRKLQLRAIQKGDTSGFEKVEGKKE